MELLRFPGRRSGLIAKDRLKLLLTSERLDCTPQMMTMLQNDMIRAVNKYFAVREQNVEIRYRKETATFMAKIPLQTDIEHSSPGISLWR
ncbi:MULTISPECIES: cell division topological specificity factor MinE [Blautia]|jgi:cell division topological specificity factor|uniref:cell division topological specificity factor MinE n=1 Tax=Blautia TaxID=572511 RepID=UPI001D01DDD8|nr:MULTISPECIES: cell division topological specificity factor MinE [Blautia]MCB5601905.1 cell division topological specificity factor MinE [Blautia hansenii]